MQVNLYGVQDARRDSNPKRSSLFTDTTIFLCIDLMFLSQTDRPITDSTIKILNFFLFCACPLNL